MSDNQDVKNKVEDFAEVFAIDRLDQYLKDSQLELEDYKTIAEANATNSRGRKKLAVEDQEFIDSKQKYYDLFSSDKFREFYVFTVKNIFAEIEDVEVLEHMMLVRRVNDVLTDIESKLEQQVVDYVSLLVGETKMSA